MAKKTSKRRTQRFSPMACEYPNKLRFSNLWPNHASAISQSKLSIFFLSICTTNLFFIPNNWKTTTYASRTEKLDDCNSFLGGIPVAPHHCSSFAENSSTFAHRLELQDHIKFNCVLY